MKRIRNMERKLLSLLLVLVMTVGWLPGTSMTARAAGETRNVSNATELTNAINDANVSKIIVTADIASGYSSGMLKDYMFTISRSLTITSDNTRRTIKGYAFDITGNNTSLVLSNIIIDGSIPVNDPTRSLVDDYLVFAENSATVTFGDGAVVQNFKKRCFGVICAGANNIIYVKEGSEFRNLGACFGAFRLNDGAKMIMSGGTIHDCEGYGNENAREGVVVFVNQGSSFEMTGGTIKNCSSEISPGTVYLHSTSNTANNNTVKLTGGTITNNTATAGGAVFSKVNESNIIQIGGSLTAVNNTGKYVNGITFPDPGNNVISAGEEGKSNIFLRDLNQIVQITSRLTGDVGIYTLTAPTDSADVKIATGAERADIQHIHSDLPGNAGVVFCDGTNDWVYHNGVAQMRSGTAHHAHEAGTVWLSLAAKESNIINNISSYTVSFNANGHGTMPEDQILEKDAKITKPQDPTASGFDFAGWYKEASCTNAWNFANDKITGATVLYAKWTLNASGKPTAKSSLSYNGTDQILINGPSTPPDGYTTVQYSIDNGSTWTDAVPKGKDAKSYTVKVKYVGDSNHQDFYGSDISVTIGKQAAPILSANQKPTAKTGLTYSGSGQDLVNAPTSLPTGYTKVQYSIDGGTTWTDTIPKGKDAKEYTVKVKYVGDSDHADFEGSDITVAIQPGGNGDGTPNDAIAGRDGAVTAAELKVAYEGRTPQSGSAADKEGLSMEEVIDGLQDEGTRAGLLAAAERAGGTSLTVTGEGEAGAAAAVQGRKADVLAAVLTPREMVDAITGNDHVDVELEVKDTGTPAADVRAAVESAKNENEQVYYLDVDMFLSKNGKKREHITKLAREISITFAIPASLRGGGRSYRLVRTHAGSGGLETAILTDGDGDPDTFTFATDMLCTLGLACASGSVSPTYAPSYSDGTSSGWSGGSSYGGSSDSGSGGGGTSGDGYLVAGRKAGRGYYAKTGKGTVAYVAPRITDKKAKGARKAVVPAKVKIGGKTYKVTSIDGYAFIGSDQLREVKIGKNVKKISPCAFAGCRRLTVIKVRSRKLTREKIKGCLKGSSVDTVTVLKKAADKYPLYRKIFTQKVTGAPGKLSVIKKK